MPQYFIAAMEWYRQHLEGIPELSRMQQLDLDYINDRLGAYYEDTAEELEEVSALQ